MNRKRQKFSQAEVQSTGEACKTILQPDLVQIEIEGNFDNRGLPTGGPLIPASLSIEVLTDWYIKY